MGQAACSGDYDNDGADDLFVTSWGQNHLYRNRGDGTFEDVTVVPGSRRKSHAGAGLRHLDYDRDGRLDLFAANYIDFDLASAPVPESVSAATKGFRSRVASRLTGGKNVLYETPAMESSRTSPSDRASRAQRRTASASVRSTSTTTGGGFGRGERLEPERVMREQQGRNLQDVSIEAGCAYSQDGKPQAGMGVAVGDYDRNGTVDLFKTNFAEIPRRCTRTAARASARIAPSRLESNHCRWLDGRRLRRSRQRRLADIFIVMGTSIRRSTDQDGSRLQTTEGRLSQPGKRTLRGCIERLGPPVTTPPRTRAALATSTTTGRSTS
jgi:hypothetical protein